MRIRVLRDFMTAELGDYSSGSVVQVADAVAKHWIKFGLAEEAKPLPILLETKPLPIKTEVKKRGRKPRRSEIAPAGA